MKVRVGCDIVDINRIRKLDTKTLQKIFHPTELKNKKPESLAGIFAAKESCKKVFNELDWLDITITKEKSGKPAIRLNTDKTIESHDVSISHDGKYAFATVVFLLK